MFSQFVKYNIVGVVNTLTGFTIIFSLMSWGVSATLSNMIGYGIGAVLSYYLNSKYTFQASAHSKSKAMKFFMVLGIAYILNYMTLQRALLYTDPYAAQVVAAIVYTVSAFILSKFFVFKETP